MSSIPTVDIDDTLDEWLDVLAAAWLASADPDKPVDDTEPMPGVPRVGRAGTTAELEAVLAMSATPTGYRYRRYFTGDRTLWTLPELDMHRLFESYDNVAGTEYPIIGSFDTTLERLIDGDPSTVESRVKDIMTMFHSVETAAGGELGGVKTFRSAVAERQRGFVADSLETIVGNHSLDPRVANLLYADFESDEDLLPVVDDGIAGHLMALAVVDYETVTRMGHEIRFESDGRVSNSFKAPYRFGPDDGLFTEHATEANIGDPAYTLLDTGDGRQFFCAFEPRENRHEIENVERTNAPGNLPQMTDAATTHLIDERLARFRKLGTLHELAQRPYADGTQPGALTSLARHLFRFGTLRAYVTAGTRDLLIEGIPDTDVDPDPDPVIPFDKLDYQTDIAQRRKFRLGADTEMRFPTLLGARVNREADPRLRQLAATHRHLAALPPAYLQRLIETALDGSSHRLDAWLTARATAALTGHLAARGHWTRPGPMTYDDLAGQSAYLPPGTLVADPDADEPTETQAPESVRIAPREPVDYDEEVVRATAVAAAAGRLHRLTVAGGSPTTIRLLDRFDAFADRPLPEGVVGAHRQLSYLSDPALSGDDTLAVVDAYDRMREAITSRTLSAVTVTRLEEFVDTLEAYAATGDGYSTLRDRLAALADTAEESTLEALVAVLAVLPAAATAARETRRPDENQYTNLPARADRRTSGRVHVGGYAFVEDLHPDDGGDPGEYVHAPSVEQATTAAVLRGGHAAFEADEGDGTVSSIDLSADRVRDANRLLEGLRDGHTLGALLGYRVERRLHETNGQRHIDAFRQEFPTFEGSLGDRPTATEAARSNVLDGAALHRSLQDGTYPTAADLPIRTDPSVAAAFDALHDSMDALTDLMTAESVHQFTRGNYDRANAALDTLETGASVPEPEVTDTPRTGVGVTHRLLVGAADVDGVTESDAWRSDVQIDRPALPAAGTTPETPSLDATDRAVRADAEPMLERWAAEHLPDPSTVGCRASYRWTRQRGVSAGTVATPATDGETTVSGLGFQPDLIRFTATPAVGPDGEDVAATTGRTGWAHGFAGKAADGTLDQRSVGIGAGEDGTATSVISTDAALTVAVHDTETSVGRIDARVTGTTDDGFTLSWTVDDDALSGKAPRIDVSYTAYATGGADGVSVGHETITASEAHSPTIQFHEGADTVWTIATDAGESVSDSTDPRSTAGRTDATPVTLSHGTVVRADAVVQRAATMTLTPGEDRLVAAHADRAVHLPSADAPTTAAAGAAGASIELGFDGVPDREFVVLYAAVDSWGSPPVLGTITDEKTTLDTRPGAIEFTSVPGGTSVGSRVSTSALAHGRALGTTDQTALHVATDEDGGVHGASTRVGIGTAAAGPCASVSGVTADGFSLDMGVSETEAVTFYLAWARDPETVTREVRTTVSVADLGLSALDVVYGSTASEEGARTPMEDHVAYHLLRTRQKADPAVPANATVELALRDAPDGADTSVAELLVVGRCVRDVLVDARPATADDLLPPAERGGTGYTETTLDELATRADDATSTLRGIGDALANRAARLAPVAGERGDPALVVRSADASDALTDLDDEMDFGAIGDAAGRHAGGSDPGDDLLTALEQLARSLPAGPTATGEGVPTVSALRAQSITVETNTPETDVDVTVVVTDGAERTVLEGTTRTDDDGVAEPTFDLTGIAAGSGYLLTAAVGGDAVATAAGRILPPRADFVAEGRTDETLTGEVPTVSPGTNLSVTVHRVEGGAATTIHSSTEAVDDDGRFTVTVDTSGVPSGTELRMTAESGSTRRYSAVGFVGDRVVEPAAVLEGATALLLTRWLAGRVAHEPTDSEWVGTGLPDAFGRLDDAALRDERDLATEWLASAERAPTPANGHRLDPVFEDVAIEAIDALLGSTDAPTTLSALVDDAAVVAAPFTATGVDDILVTVGGPRAEDARLHLSTTDGAASVRTALATAIRNPSALATPTGAPVAPEFRAFASGEPALPDGIADRLASHLEALSTRVDTVVRSEAADQVAVAIAFALVAGLKDLLLHPKSFSAERSTFEGTVDEFLAAFDEVGYESKLDDARAALDGVPESTGEVERSGVRSALFRLAGAGSETAATAAVVSLETAVYDLDATAATQAASDAVAELDAATRTLDTAVQAADWGALEWLTEWLGDAPAVLDRRGIERDDATAATDLIALVDAVRPRLTDYQTALTTASTDEAFDPAAARASFSTRHADAVTAIADAATSLAEAARTLRRSVDVGDALRQILLEGSRVPLYRAAAFGVPGAMPASAAGVDLDDARVLRTQVQTVYTRCAERTADAVAAGATAASDVDELVEREQARLAALFGDSFLVAPAFEPANAAEVTQAFSATRRTTLLADAPPLAVETWIGRTARVRDRIATYQDLTTYAEALAGASRERVHLAQLPGGGTAQWVGLDGTVPERGCVSIVAGFEAGLAQGDDVIGSRIAAVLVDEWAESVPAETETTGIAVNYDDPNTEPPQAILIAPPPTDGWSDGAVVRTVLDTFDLARIRGVDLGVLGKPTGGAMHALGQLFPGLYFPLNTKHVPDLPSVDFDVDRWALPDGPLEYSPVFLATVGEYFLPMVSVGSTVPGADARTDGGRR